MVLTLRDGSKLEVRSLPEFERNYKYIYERTSARYYCAAIDQINKNKIKRLRELCLNTTVGTAIRWQSHTLMWTHIGQVLLYSQ